jgi:hypothetical protein
VKQLLLLCLIFLAFTRFSSGEGRTLSQTSSTSTVQPTIEKSNFDQDHSAQVRNCSLMDYDALKGRWQRVHLAAPSFDAELEIPAFQSAKQSASYISPPYLPLIRLLLYPSHYFW